jgi:hypothetical protein
VGVTKAAWSSRSLRSAALVLGRPVTPAEQHHRQLWLTNHSEIWTQGDEAARRGLQVDRGVDGISVGVGAVQCQREPQRQAPGAAGDVVGVVARVPLLGGVGVEYVEEGRFRSVHLLAR